MHKRVQRYVCSRIQSRRRETAGRHTLPCSPYSTVAEIRASHGTVQVSTLFLRLADKFCDNFGVKPPFRVAFGDFLLHYLCSIWTTNSVGSLRAPQ